MEGVLVTIENLINLNAPFTGTYYTMTMLGPALGYVLGGQLLLIYTDFLQIDVSE